MSGSGELVIYTDGGANPNPGPGGWAAVLTRDGDVLSELTGSASDTTNNRMELSGAIAALESQSSGSSFTLVTDSQYVRQGITSWIKSWVRNGWQRGRGSQRQPVKNADLWQRLHTLDLARDVHWRWTKGHAGNRFNERADELATLEIEKLAGPARARETAAPSTSSPAETDWHIVLRVRCVRAAGAWAAEVRDPEGAVAVRSAADRGPVSANRLELLGALSLLEEIPREQSVLLECGDYLRRGATEWLANWRRNRWQTAGGDPVKNADLWRALEKLLRPNLEFARSDASGEVMKRLRKELRAAG